MATKNSLNNKSQELTLDPGAAGGDSFVQFDINSTGEFRVGVDDTDDSFRISQGSALGTNDTFVMTDAGERTMPLQPAFLARLGTTDSNVTGSGTFYTLGTGNALTEVFDQGGDFNTNGTFTAPVTGIYILAGNLSTTNSVTSSMIYATLDIVTSNRIYREYQQPFNNQVSGGMTMSVTAICEMEASDTATLYLGIDGGAGDTVDINGQASEARTYFSGALLV